jgi:hypothetical protein
VVVGFGAAAGEDDFLGAGADEGGDLFAGGFDGSAGALAGGVDGGSVGKFARKIGEHGVEHFRLGGRGGVEIEVDAVHESAFSIAGRETRGIPPPRLFLGKSVEMTEKKRFVIFVGAKEFAIG